MKILCVGDVVGDPGREYLSRKLQGLKKKYNVDFTIVNGENSYKSNGITPKSAEEIFDAGADVITTGNHAYKRKEMYDYFNENEYVIRPINYPEVCPGTGICKIDFIKTSVAVVNIMGTVFMENLPSPFLMIDSILEGISEKIIIIDFHAEATSEKIAFASYVDGRVSAVVGTHTHVQTADERILSNGTAFITDLGMTGPKDSSLGVRIDQVIRRYKTCMPTRYSIEENSECMLCGAVIDVDDITGKSKSIIRIQV